jgi:hypothetical protein
MKIQKNGKRKSFIFSLCVLLVIAIGCTLFFVSCSNPRSTANVLKADLILNGNPDNIKPGDVLSISQRKGNSEDSQYVKVVEISKPSQSDYNKASDYNQTMHGENTQNEKVSNQVKVTFALTAQQKDFFATLDLNAAQVKLMCRSGSSQAQELLQKEDSIISSVSSSTASQGK